MLGTSKSGKISIYKNLSQDYNIDLLNRLNVKTIKFKECNITIWTYSNPGIIRTLLKKIYSNIDGIIYAVDSNDRDRIEDGKKI